MDLSHINLRPTEGDQFLAVANGRYFYVGHLLRDIIDLAKVDANPQTISARLNETHGISIEPEQIETSLSQVVDRLGCATDTEEELKNSGRSAYINLRVRLLNGKRVQRLVEPLKFLFSPRFAIPLSILGVLAILAYYTLPATTPLVSMGGWEIASAYLCLFAIFFFHEVGHATASKYYGVNPDEISFGFYLVFPVFFADVSNIWSLNKRKRIIINLGGVYFQLLVSIVLVGLTFLYPGNSILHSIIHTNLFVIVYSLVPFLRYDGYWIYSDYFEIPNLMQRSIRYPLKAIREFRQGIPLNIPLLFYSVTNYVVLTIVFYYVGKYCTLSAVIVSQQITQISNPMEIFTHQNLSGLFRIFTVTFMGCFLTYRLIRYGRKQFLSYV